MLQVFLDLVPTSMGNGLAAHGFPLQLLTQ